MRSRVIRGEGDVVRRVEILRGNFDSEGEGQKLIYCRHYIAAVRDCERAILLH